MRNLVFKISYLGSCYHGFQRQKNAITIQEELENAIFTLTGETVSITGCGRTDAGVHALNYYFNFLSQSKIPCNKFPLALNTKLPPDIRIHECFEAENDFHSRFSAIKKTYMYIIDNSPTADPFMLDRAYFFPQKMNLSRMKRAAEFIKGTHDFKAFMAQGSPVNNTVRTVYDLEIKKSKNLIYISVTGNGFLYNMVRIIVGTLIFVGIGKIDEVYIKDILDEKKRELAGVTAPPCGLYLKDVFYKYTKY